MLVDQIKELILSGLPGAEVQVETDGYHYQVRVISDRFEGLSLVKRQQAVYACIGHLINDGTLHSVPMKTYTPGEWQSLQG